MGITSNKLTLSSGLSNKGNSIGFLRVLLAVAVIASHTYPLGGFEGDLLAPLKAHDTLGGVAVAGFFSISGYLIVKSAMNSDALQFFWRRALRIFPAYWASLLLAGFVVGPLVWKLSGKSLSVYFSNSVNGPISYLLSNWNLSIGQYGIFDIFSETTPYGIRTSSSVFNGSIWTLIYEWNCYLLIGGLLAFGAIKYAKLIVPIIASFLFLFQTMNLVVPGQVGKAFPFLSDGFTISLGLAFFVSATLGIYGDKIPLNNKLGLGAFALAFATLLQGGWPLFGYLALPYCLLWLSVKLPKFLQKIGAKNDYSYGIYVYGFLVQQITAYLGLYKLGPSLWFGIVICITFVLSWFSWYLIEKPFLSLKNWGPGLGLEFWRGEVQNLGRRGKN